MGLYGELKSTGLSVAEATMPERIWLAVKADECHVLTSERMMTAYRDEYGYDVFAYGLESS